MPSRSVEPGPRHQNSSDEIGRLALEKPPLSSPSALDRTPSLPAQSQAMQLHPEIRSVVTLTHAHAHKVYMSGPLIRRVERLPDGHHPIKDEGWRDVWAQLGGTTLSIWDMKEIDEASKQIIGEDEGGAGIGGALGEQIPGGVDEGGNNDERQ